MAKSTESKETESKETKPAETLQELDSQRGVVDPRNAEMTGSPEDDPTRFGTRRDMTPLDTRSIGDAASGRDDADQSLASFEQGLRRRGQKSNDQEVSETEVELGGKGMKRFDVDEMTPEQAKLQLLQYGVDAPVAQAKARLREVVERADKAGSKLN